MRIFFNQSWSKERRQQLRHMMTDPERILWSALRGKSLGVKFRRQQGIGSYIADFYAAKLKLVVEVDGDSHFDAEGLRMMRSAMRICVRRGFPFFDLRTIRYDTTSTEFLQQFRM